MEAKRDEVARLLGVLDEVNDAGARERGRERIAAVYAGDETDCLPILYDVPAHDVAVESDLREQFYSPEAMLIAHLHRMAATAKLPHDGQLCIRPNMGVVLVPSVFGLEPEVPSDAMPRFRDHLTKNELTTFDLPSDLAACGLVSRAANYVRYFRDTLAGRAHVYMPDTQGVFDVAHLVLGDQFFLELYDDPPFAHHALGLSLRAYVGVTLALKAALDEAPEGGFHGHGMVSGIYMPHGGVRVSEDTPTLLQPEHIDAFVVPYVLRALEPFGGGWVHYCGRNDHLFAALLSIPEVRGINLGNPEQHDPEAYMHALLERGKFYFGCWPREVGESLRSYLERMLALTGDQKRGLIFLLTPQELRSDSPLEAIGLWRDLQR